MTKRIAPTILLLAATTTLGGCQSIFGKPFAMKSRADLSESDVQSYFAARLEAGKQHLRNDRPAQAAVAFRQASYDHTVAAEAFNGMAVAYAKIGRNDLAERYFTMAIERNPADERFARNLARFEAQTVPTVDPVMMALEQNDAEQPGEVAELEPVKQAAETIAAVEERALPSGVTLAIGSTSMAIQRVSQREVRIGAAPVAKTSVAVRQKIAPKVKVHQVRALSPSRSTSTVRIGFDTPKSTEKRPSVYHIPSGSKAQSYPIRVALGPKEDKKD